MAVSIPVSGFGGWGQHVDRRLGIIAAQFGAANQTRHPTLQLVSAEETRGFWRDCKFSPSNQAYHWCHNAESYWLIGQAMAAGMLQHLLPSRSTPNALVHLPVTTTTPAHPITARSSVVDLTAVESDVEEGCVV
uniref:Uncharacterized protein n=1 Tax=Haptolina ericina TaxID=156174 RepID=A0A7S3FAY1_9EUKA|mmetsp:Transcript_61110/g.136127  ORF Transcript_61110/g.136127 Transcript_61110/m.136127 type:complete len:134 (+) Transcript_61110:47-448(+)